MVSHSGLIVPLTNILTKCILHIIIILYPVYARDNNNVDITWESMVRFQLYCAGTDGSRSDYQHDPELYSISMSYHVKSSIIFNRCVISCKVLQKKLAVAHFTN